MNHTETCWEFIQRIHYATIIKQCVSSVVDVLTRNQMVNFVFTEMVDGSQRCQIQVALDVSTDQSNTKIVI